MQVINRIAHMVLLRRRCHPLKGLRGGRRLAQQAKHLRNNRATCRHCHRCRREGFLGLPERCANAAKDDAQLPNHRTALPERRCDRPGRCSAMLATGFAFPNIVTSRWKRPTFARSRIVGGFHQFFDHQVAQRFQNKMLQSAKEARLEVDQAQRADCFTARQ